MSMEKGLLYIVATPIGNLQDMTPRAIEVLKQVHRIAAEDTRRSGILLQQFAINTPMMALHEHNERVACEKLVKQLQAGESIALISDAGTPLISDPGYHLVRAAQDADCKVVPVPGASALLTALSAAGLPTDRFIFEGFMPTKAGPRQRRLEAMAQETCTLVYYEAPHRITDTLEAMVKAFGPEREAVIARELTKTFETIHRDNLAQLWEWVQNDANQQKGEIVILVEGAQEADEQYLSSEDSRIIELLASELPLKQASALAAKITGKKKNLLYQHMVEKGKKDK